MLYENKIRSKILYMHEIFVRRKLPAIRCVVYLITLFNVCPVTNAEMKEMMEEMIQ